MKLKDFPIMDFSGGLVCNKSDYEMDRNEMKTLINFDIDEKGKLKRRRGSHQFGTTITGKVIDNSYTFGYYTLGTSVVYYHLIVDRTAGTGSATLYKMLLDYTTSAITTASTQVAVKLNGFAATGTVVIDGDIITYTGKSSLNLTGATGITSNHPVNSMVTQISTVGTLTGHETSMGIYFSSLNGLCFINGRAANSTFDGTTITAITDDDQPAGLFATNYRDRIYVAGTGATNAADTRNSNPIRVSYSDAGDATSWDINNYFDVEENLGEMITGLRANDDNLFILKANSIFTYNEVQLKQQLWGVGAYNHRCIENIGNMFYTTCPKGVFITNGFSAKKISEPIEKYLNMFRPTFNNDGSVWGRVCTNIISFQFENKYHIYLGTITDPDDLSKTLSDVVLVYDTKKGNWTIHTNYTNFTHITTLPIWGGGTLEDTSVSGPSQMCEAVFAGDSGGKYWKLYDNKFFNGETTRALSGGDITENLLSDTGSPISCVAETPFYDLGNPSWWKNFDKLRVLIEKGEFDISYRLDKGDYFTDWISLGNFNKPNKLISLPDKKGYRISFKVTSNTKDVLSVLNGLIIENIDAEQKK
jgi:hypothetical protein